MDYLAEAHVGRARMAGLLDAPLWVPIQPASRKLVSFDDQARRFSAFVVGAASNDSALASPECQAAHPSEQGWKCIEPAFRLPFVRTPYFLAHSQYDAFGITVNVFGRYSPGRRLSPAQRHYAGRYRREVLRYLPTPAEGSGAAVFSPARYLHLLLSSGAFWTVEAG
eukprot:CAMPEP_0204595400 /NCGR_PEP_ID=MMETSP0661-20131031/52653_1 /ASSEMBLY_ACC=CAM_ASM_000606 /TAXON_ID=109239 /ORGANISM="Alexandrium margalefi, Strain AMGDE01CS-322" /LENGTH=166 /DNA_ID=CAMNT_0051605923 /DNA_START=13 /DNA_END=509 /DNA_ORIENTATION=+